MTGTTPDGSLVISEREALRGWIFTVTRLISEMAQRQSGMDHLRAELGREWQVLNRVLERGDD